MEVTADKARSPCACENASTEPNAPQPPHLPNHLAVWKPHWRQTCCTAALEEPMRAPYEGGLTWSENATPRRALCGLHARRRRHRVLHPAKCYARWHARSRDRRRELGDGV